MSEDHDTLPPGPEDEWGRFASGLDGFRRRVWVRPGHAAEKHPAIELLEPCRAVAIIDHWAHDDARTLERVHEQLCGPGDDLDPDRRWTRMVRRLRDEVASGWLVLHRERPRGAAPGTLPVQPARPSPRPAPARPVTPDGELSFYELEVVDECEGPLAGVRVELWTPAGLQRVHTDGSGRARVDDVPAGWATARLVDVARVHEVLGRRDRRARRVAPLEEDDDTELSMTLGGAVQRGVVLADAEPRRLRLVTRTDVRWDQVAPWWMQLELIQGEDRAHFIPGAPAIDVCARALRERACIAEASPVPAREPRAPLPPPLDEPTWLPPAQLRVPAGVTWAQLATQYLGDPGRWSEVASGRPPMDADEPFPAPVVLTMPSSTIPAWVQELTTAAPAALVAPAEEPRGAAPFWEAVVDELHDRLFDGDLERVAELIQPGTAPPPPVPSAPDPMETLWHLAELGRLAAEGWPFWERRGGDEPVT